MLALNRIAILKQRIKYEKISIGIKININRNGHSGMNSFKKDIPKFLNPVMNKPPIKLNDKKKMFII